VNEIIYFTYWKHTDVMHMKKQYIQRLHINIRHEKKRKKKTWAKHTQKEKKVAADKKLAKNSIHHLCYTHMHILSTPSLFPYFPYHPSVYTYIYIYASYIYNTSKAGLVPMKTEDSGFSWPYHSTCTASTRWWSSPPCTRQRGLM
jgi:hypothetical protein